MFNLQDLRFQWDWTGARLQNLRILVCEDCYDTPQEQLRARILSPDPVPLFNPRPEPFYATGVGVEQTRYFNTENTVMNFLTEDTLNFLSPEGEVIMEAFPPPPPPFGNFIVPWFFIF